VTDDLANFGIRNWRMRAKDPKEKKEKKIVPES
jgi:hypothetical protein